MDGLLFSLVPLPPGYWIVWFSIPVVVVGIFVRLTARKDHEMERDRRAVLGCAAVWGGPLFGACLGRLSIQFGGVNALDIPYTYCVSIGIGAFAGFLIGCAFAVTSLFLARSDPGKKSPTKAPDSWDEF